MVDILIVDDLADRGKLSTFRLRETGFSAVMIDHAHAKPFLESGRAIAAVVVRLKLDEEDVFGLARLAIQKGIPAVLVSEYGVSALREVIGFGRMEKLFLANGFDTDVLAQHITVLLTTPPAEQFSLFRLRMPSAILRVFHRLRDLLSSFGQFRA